MTEEVPIKKPEVKPYRSSDSFISGGIAGMVTKTCIAPFERVKLIYLTSDRQFKYRDAVSRLARIAVDDGARGLWRGNSMNMLRVFPYTAIVVSNNKRHSERTTGCGIIFQQIIR